ncbi:MAG TPA: 30S ribosomal protein S3ae, partial [Candidatus Thermoplasmatota archaeon]|nr:30S ribosomal protein S3ae [Candidatus Thermoplasmatota archaeon]
MAQDKGEQAAQAKKKVSRTAVRKVKDKWKAKQWYNIRAPPMYNGAIIAETLADEGDKLMGRVAEATLQDLTGDFSKMHIKMKFKVQAVRGNECATKFAGHELTSDYIRRLTRR